MTSPAPCLVLSALGNVCVGGGQLYIVSSLVDIHPPSTSRYVVSSSGSLSWAYQMSVDGSFGGHAMAFHCNNISPVSFQKFSYQNNTSDIIVAGRRRRGRITGTRRPLIIEPGRPQSRSSAAQNDRLGSSRGAEPRTEPRSCYPVIWWWCCFRDD